MSSNSNYSCYIGAVSFVFGISFNIFYINNLCYKYEERINKIERLSCQQEVTNKHLKYKMNYKYEVLNHDIHLLHTKIEELDKKMTSFIEEKNNYYSKCNYISDINDSDTISSDMNDSDTINSDNDVETMINWSMV
jgi:hypothetical protein